MRKYISVSQFSKDGSALKDFEEDNVGFIRIIRIMWDFWRHNGTRHNDWSRITIFVSKDKLK